MSVFSQGLLNLSPCLPWPQGVGIFSHWGAKRSHLPLVSAWGRLDVYAYGLSGCSGPLAVGSGKPWRAVTTCICAPKHIRSLRSCLFCFWTSLKLHMWINRNGCKIVLGFFLKAHSIFKQNWRRRWNLFWDTSWRWLVAHMHWSVGSWPSEPGAPTRKGKGVRWLHNMPGTSLAGGWASNQLTMGN